MTTVAEALNDMRLPVAGNSDRIIASIDGGKCVHYWASDNLDVDLEDIGENVYVTSARYEPKTGRKTENARFIDQLPFDIDLKDYFGLPTEQIHAWTDEQINEAIEALVADTRDTFDRAGVPIHQITYTGYGLGVFTRLHPDDQTRVQDAIDLHKNLVQHINTVYGGTLVDPAVSDAGSRLSRIVGHFNHKASTPRATRVIADYAGTARIDQFSFDPIPRQTHRAVPERSLDAAVADDIVLAVARGYDEGDRHAIALGLTALLLKKGVPGDQALDIIERLSSEDEEQRNRLDACRDTIRRFEQDLPISGHYALRHRIPSSILDYVNGLLTPRPQVAAVEEEETSESETSAYAPPPENAYYGWFADYRRLMAPCTSGADAFHLASSLVYAGASVGRQISVQQAGQHYPVLMTVLVGETGKAKKDTCANLARDLFARQITGRDSDAMPYNILSDVSTSEGLAAFLDATSPRCMVHTSEFNSLINKARREVGGGLMPMLQKVWDGVDHYDLPTRTKPIRVEFPSVSLLGTITPDILARYMSVDDIQSGFANRVLWVYGSGKGWIASPPQPDVAEQSRLIRAFCAARDSIIQQKPQLGKTQAFQSRWSDWSYELYHRRHDNEDDQHLAERLEANAVRVASLFAISDGCVRIDVCHLDAAIAFVMWCFDNTRREARLWGSSDELKVQEHILELLRTKDRDRREVFYRLKRYSAGMLKQAIDNLHFMEVIETNKDLRLSLR